MDLLHRDQGVILRLDRWSDATLRCSPSLRIPPLVSLGAVLLMCARRAAKPKLLQAERVTALISFAFPRQFVFSLALRFSWRDSSVLATGDWRFAFPGDSRQAGRGLVVLQLNDTIKSRFLVAFGASAPSSLRSSLNKDVLAHTILLPR